MSKPFKFLSLPNLHYFAEGLTFKVSSIADVLDGALASLNHETRIPDRIFAWNQKNPASRPPLAFPGGRVIVDVSQSYSPQKGMLYLAQVIRKTDEKEAAPVVFFSMRSPSLDIPMRTEVPLRALIKGSGVLKGTYSVYLHCLVADDGNEFVYYGITKRGWNSRFDEHTQAALREESLRLFPSKLRELCGARADQLYGTASGGPKLAGIVTAICATGLDESAAMDTEEYLVDKYSLSSKHLNGLNMLPGGREGIRQLSRLFPASTATLRETEDREDALARYLLQHPQLGRPRPGVAAKWNDPAYAEAVICARENRLSADQVRRIRYLSALGNSIDAVRQQVGAIDNGQVARVLEGRTYSRIQ
jgi:hypothetical protein